jgi:hypothetical protein
MAIASGVDGDGRRDECLAFPVLLQFIPYLFRLPSSGILLIFGHGNGDAQVLLALGCLGDD